MWIMNHTETLPYKIILKGLILIDYTIAFGGMSALPAKLTGLVRLG